MRPYETVASLLELGMRWEAQGVRGNAEPLKGTETTGESQQRDAFPRRLSPVEEGWLADVGATDEDDGGEKRGVHLGEVEARLLHGVLPGLGLALGPRGGRWILGGSGVAEAGGETKPREGRNRSTCGEGDGRWGREGSLGVSLGTGDWPYREDAAAGGSEQRGLDGGAVAPRLPDGPGGGRRGERRRRPP